MKAVLVRNHMTAFFIAICLWIFSVPSILDHFELTMSDQYLGPGRIPRFCLTQPQKWKMLPKPLGLSFHLISLPSCHYYIIAFAIFILNFAKNGPDPHSLDPVTSIQNLTWEFLGRYLLFGGFGVQPGSTSDKFSHTLPDPADQPHGRGTGKTWEDQSPHGVSVACVGLWHQPRLGTISWITICSSEKMSL
jgi:hypothetical protein